MKTLPPAADAAAAAAASAKAKADADAKASADKAAADKAAAPPRPASPAAMGDRRGVREAPPRAAARFGGLDLGGLGSPPFGGPLCDLEDLHWPVEREAGGRRRERWEM